MTWAISVGRLARRLRKLLRRGRLPGQLREARGATETQVVLQGVLETEEVKAYAARVFQEATRSPVYKACVEEHGDSGPCVLACIAYTAGKDEEVAERLQTANQSLVVSQAMSKGSAREAWRVRRDFARLKKILEAAVEECAGD